MIYKKDREGLEISQLGFGCMRFTKKGTSIVYEKAKKEMLRAIELGVNYFDTAYIYPGSEDFLGKFMEETGLRDQMLIATKLPQYLMKSRDQMEKIFSEQLKRLKTDYIDYYLMHMFTDYAEWEHLLSIGIEDWIADHKADGSIRSFGFSYHGDTDMFLKILDAYDWDFCQIQYNYLDEHSQAGRRGLEAAREKGIPVIIMEPLRGGKLVNLPPESRKLLAESEKKYTAPELGLRWLWDQEGITCVLSGMNSIEMIEENVRIASDARVGDFTEKDFELIEKVKDEIKRKEKVGCTSCRYCMPCPKGVDIPGNFYYYNLMFIEKKTSARFDFAQNMALRVKPGFASLCIDCGKCEKHCPQQIPIRKVLREADKALRPLPYKLGIGIARKIMIRNS